MLVFIQSESPTSLFKLLDFKICTHLIYQYKDKWMIKCKRYKSPNHKSTLSHLQSETKPTYSFVNIQDSESLTRVSDSFESLLLKLKNLWNLRQTFLIQVTLHCIY